MVGTAAAPSFTPAGGMSVDPLASGAGFSAQGDMPPPAPRPGSLTVTPLNAAQNLGMGADPFRLGAGSAPPVNSGAAGPPPSAPVPAPRRGGLSAAPLGPADDPFGIKAMAAGPVPQGPGTDNAFGLARNSAPPPPPPPAAAPVPPQPQPAAPTLPANNPATPVHRPTPTAGAVVSGRPAAPSGPTGDPRVNRRFAQWQKEYASVIKAGDKVMEEQAEVAEQERDRDDRFAGRLERLPAGREGAAGPHPARSRRRCEREGRSEPVLEEQEHG